MSIDGVLSVAALALSVLAICAAIYASWLNAQLTRRLNAPAFQLTKLDPPFIMGGSPAEGINALEERQNLYLIFSGLVPGIVQTGVVQPNVNSVAIRVTNSGKTGAAKVSVTFDAKRTIQTITVKFPFDSSSQSHRSANGRSGEVHAESLPVGQSLEFDVLLEPLRQGGVVNLEPIAQGLYSWESFGDPNHPQNPQTNTVYQGAMNVRGTASLDVVNILASCDNCEEPGRLD